MAKKQTKKTRSPKKETSRHKRTFWKIFAGGVGFVLLLFLLASWGVFGSLPDETSLENPEKNLATEIISSDGKTIGKFYKENRTPVPFDELPAHLVNALVATEDIRFYDHSGVDVRGTLRAAVYLGSKGGASTISQQLARPDGTWLGTGLGSIKENKFWYKENVSFNEEGIYKLTIAQAVRNNGEVEGVTDLKGITDIGFSIEEANK